MLPLLLVFLPALRSLFLSATPMQPAAFELKLPYWGCKVLAGVWQKLWPFKGEFKCKPVMKGWRGHWRKRHDRRYSHSVWIYPMNHRGVYRQGVSFLRFVLKWYQAICSDLPLACLHIILICMREWCTFTDAVSYHTSITCYLRLHLQSHLSICADVSVEAVENVTNSINWKRFETSAHVEV